MIRHAAADMPSPCPAINHPLVRPPPYPATVAFERITIEPGKMRGAPCIRGLPIPVATVIGQLAAGRTAEQILADFPDLQPEDIPAALEYAAEAVQERELPSLALREVPRRRQRVTTRRVTAHSGWS